jgi:hypothetical protein
MGVWKGYLCPAGGPAPARPEHPDLTAAVIGLFNPMILGLAVLLGLVYYLLGQLAVYLALPFVTYIIQLVELSGVRE